MRLTNEIVIPKETLLGSKLKPSELLKEAFSVALTDLDIRMQKEQFLPYQIHIRISAVKEDSDEGNRGEETQAAGSSDHAGIGDGLLAGVPGDACNHAQGNGWESDKQGGADHSASSGVRESVPGAQEAAPGRTIYLVTQGVYSDYGVLSAWSCREDAERMADGLQDGAVEEFQLDQHVHLLARGLKPYHVYLHGNGKTVVIQCGDYNGTGGLIPWNYTAQGHWRTDGFRVFVNARDEKHAAKIASEKRARFIAEGGG